MQEARPGVVVKVREVQGRNPGRLEGLEEGGRGVHCVCPGAEGASEESRQKLTATQYRG